MPRIHASAIVGPQAELADDVEIGPGCVIDGAVRVGAGSRLIGHVYLHGPLVLGENNTLYPFVCLGFAPQDRKYNGQTAGVLIGRDNVFREGATVHCATRVDRPTTIGDDNYFMANAHAGHDAVVGHRCTLANGAMMGGHSRLDDQVNVGGGAGIHQFCRMGRLSFLGGVSSTTKDLPPFCIATGHNLCIGLNRVGLRRTGLPRTAVDEVAAAFSVLYLSGHTNPVAAGMLEEMAARNGPGASLVAELARFVRESQRGLVPIAPSSLRRRAHDED